MLRRSGSRRDTPVVVEDYNLAAGGRRGMTKPRIDTGSWTQKGKNEKEAIGKAWSKFFHIAGVPGIQADTEACFPACFTMCVIKWMRA
jgi:hypothetical protein